MKKTVQPDSAVSAAVPQLQQLRDEVDTLQHEVLRLRELKVKREALWATVQKLKVLARCDENDAMATDLQQEADELLAAVSKDAALSNLKPEPLQTVGQQGARAGSKVAFDEELVQQESAAAAELNAFREQTNKKEHRRKRRGKKKPKQRSVVVPPPPPETTAVNEEDGGSARGDADPAPMLAALEAFSATLPPITTNAARPPVWLSEFEAETAVIGVVGRVSDSASAPEAESYGDDFDDVPDE